MVDALRLDLRHSLRRLKKTPAFTIIVILTIAIVLVANTAIFSVLNAVVLRKLNVVKPDELVMISASDARTNQPGYFYKDTVAAYRTAQRSFSHITMYNGGGVLRVARPGGEENNVGVEAVSPEYFDLIATAPAAGRYFTTDDESAATVVASHRFSSRLFGEPAAAIGKTLLVSGREVTISGVMPQSFTGFAFDGGSDLFMSFPTLITVLTSPNPAIRSPQLIARLAPGVSLTAAEAELSGRWDAIQQATLGSIPAGMRPSISSQRVRIESFAHGSSGLRRIYGNALSVLMGLALVLLVVAAVNLSGLLLARSLSRAHEFAVQRALGAPRMRLVSQSVLDGLLLSIAGLIAALPLSWWLTNSIEPMLVARALPLQYALTPSAGVIAIAIVTTLVVGTLIGALSASRALRSSAESALQSSRGSSRAMGWAGRGVIAAQVALALVLVCGAGLFVATLSNLYDGDSAHRTTPVIWTRLAQNSGVRGNPDENYVRALTESLAKIDGANGAALSFYYPAYLGFPGVTTNTTLTAGADPGARSTVGMTEYVTPGFFDVTGITRRSGRDLAWTDGTKAQPVGLLSESAAHHLFGDGDPIGHEIHATTNGVTTRVTIVGVVSDAPIGRIDEPHVAVVFRPMMQSLTQAASPLGHVRVNVDSAAARDGYVNAVNVLGRHGVRALFTIDGWVDDALLQQRLIAGVSTAASVIATLLAAIGVFGVLAYAVAARIREVGIRMSIGATPSSIIKMIVREGAMLVIGGVAIGVPAALGASGLVRAQLYGISAGDPRIMIGAALTFVIVGLIATALPAIRASRVRPMDALRQD